jgi:hypothetical protein
VIAPVGEKLGDEGDARGRDFIQPIFAMHDQARARAQIAQGFSQGFEPFAVEHAEQLPFRARRIGKRTQQIEDRANTQRAPGWPHMAHGAVVGGCEQEGDAGARSGSLQLSRLGEQVDADRFKHFSGAGLGRGGLIAMLGDHGAGPGGDQRCRG